MQSWMDDEICKETAAKCGGVVSEPFKNVETLIGYIENSKFVLGMRLHVLIYALSVNVPIVALSYDPKVDAIIEKWNCSKAFDIENINVEAVLAEIDYIIENTDEISESIAKTTKLMKEKNVCDAKAAVELMEF